MQAADWLVEKLIECGVTDAFGIPGGVVLDLLYAMNAQSNRLKPHLSYHEQGAGFEAIGYAQMHATLGVAYATRGPGLTNLVTAIADAWQESIPVLFITAHAQCSTSDGMRMAYDQELDAVHLLSTVTKYAKRIDSIHDFEQSVNEACACALRGRKGPVLIDVLASLWKQEMPHITEIQTQQDVLPACGVPQELLEQLNASERPVVLAGGGVQQSGTEKEVLDFAKKMNIPILSSRGSQDLFAGETHYYGYVGSHGIRYSNFILSKADLILSLGNRLSFPLQSESFRPLIKRAKVVRVEVDGAELTRSFPNRLDFHMDLNDFFAGMRGKNLQMKDGAWLDVCNRLRQVLYACDMSPICVQLGEIFKRLPRNFGAVVADVGNHEFWVSRAYEYASNRFRLLYSRSFGTLGCALPKAIGACCRVKRPVMCITGDQGFQMNIQELQTLAALRLPVAVLLLNNHASGMIRDHERQKFGEMLIHVTEGNGYSQPDFEQIARAYGIAYMRVRGIEAVEAIQKMDGPLLLEMDADGEQKLAPELPKGHACQNMAPPLEADLYDKLNAL